MDRLTEWYDDGEYKGVMVKEEYGDKVFETFFSEPDERYLGMYVLKSYEDTGLTPEQVQELKERDTAKEPDYEGDGCDKDGNIIYDTWICPNCSARYEIEYDDYDFCPRCGQRILKED